MEKAYWYTGKKNFLEHNLLHNSAEEKWYYVCKIKDVEVNNHNLTDAFMYNLEHRQGTCELLLSGGVRSEFILRFLLQQKIPTKVITMKLMLHNAPINLIDLYNSEHICRELGVKQHFLELDIEKFYNHFEYMDFNKTHFVRNFHATTYFWMLTQCDDFPISGGEYPWPWESKNILCPMLLGLNANDKFMNENKIVGIGNMMSYSLDSMLVFLKEHRKHITSPDIRLAEIPMFEEKLFSGFDLGEFKPRLKVFAWDYLPDYIFPHKHHQKFLEEHYKEQETYITWGEKIVEVIGENDEQINNMF